MMHRGRNWEDRFESRDQQCDDATTEGRLACHGWEIDRPGPTVEKISQCRRCSTWQRAIWGVAHYGDEGQLVWGC